MTAIPKNSRREKRHGQDREQRQMKQRKRRKFVCQREDLEITKTGFEEMRSTRRECTLYYGEKAATT